MSYTPPRKGSFYSSTHTSNTVTYDEFLAKVSNENSLKSNVEKYAENKNAQYNIYVP